MLGFMRAEKDGNGFVNYYDLDENTQKSLAALALSAKISEPIGSYDENNLYSLGYSTDTLEMFSLTYRDALKDILNSEAQSETKKYKLKVPELYSYLTDYPPLTFNSIMIDELAYNYIVLVKVCGNQVR